MSALTAVVDGRMKVTEMMGQNCEVPPPLCSDYTRPDKDEAIQAKYSRFSAK